MAEWSGIVRLARSEPHARSRACPRTVSVTTSYGPVRQRHTLCNASVAPRPVADPGQGWTNDRPGISRDHLVFGPKEAVCVGP